MTAQTHLQIQYVSDESGQPVSVLVPIELWREIASERGMAPAKQPRPTNLKDEPFIGMWSDREDLADSSQAVRELRKSEWGDAS